MILKERRKPSRPREEMSGKAEEDEKEEEDEANVMNVVPLLEWTLWKVFKGWREEFPNRWTFPILSPHTSKWLR